MENNDVAQRAFDSAQSAHHRLDGLEREVGDLRTLTVAVGKMGERLDGVKTDIAEIKADVKNINAKPGKMQDKFLGAVVAALAAGLVAAILALILK